MKRHLFIISAIVGILSVVSSCKKEDDLDKIFYGRTWYMASGKIQGQPIVGDNLKKFYSSENAYYVSFGTETVTGSLEAGRTFSGTWTVDGKARTLHFEIHTTLSTNDVMDRSLYGILQKTVRYSGDENILTLYADDYNYIGFSAKRSESSEY